MARRGEVLVAIINSHRDLEIAQEKHWYRIPVSSQRRFLKDCWPPRWVAFYQTKAFGDEAYGVRYYARVVHVRTVPRLVLFPDMPRNHPKAGQIYYQLFLEPLETLPKPILARRRRRVVFIPTTWAKFANALEINDLWDESSLEDRMWAMFKRASIPAERQFYLPLGAQNYLLDFALFCDQGNIDVETDGDSWHTEKEQAASDRRDNDLESAGWHVLRFNAEEISEQADSHCLPKVVQTIDRLGGLDDGGLAPRPAPASEPLGPQQLGLFDDP